MARSSRCKVCVHGRPIAPSAVPRRTIYRVYYQYNGGIHAGYVIKSGTTLQFAPLGGGTPQDDYYVLNRTAVQSIESAINF